MGIKDLFAGMMQPAADAFRARSERKAAEKSLEAKIAEKKIDSTTQVEFNHQEWERLSKWAEESTWKDEYVTVSVVLIFNLIVFGGVLTAFGMPQVLDGVTLAMRTLTEIGVDVGGILKAVIYAAIGIYAMRKVL